MLLLAAGCGDDGDTGVGGDASPGDGGDAGEPGDGGACAVWQLQPSAAVSTLRLESGAHNADKTLRVLVETSLGACELPAIPEVDVSDEKRSASIRLMVWRQVEGDCAGEEVAIVRAIPLRIGAAGKWTIESAGESVQVDVEPAPDRACGVPVGTQCAMDCDCAEEGEDLRCLSGSGIAGPFNQCGRVCEFDRDCGGEGTCESIADGLSFACSGIAECGELGLDCPGGWSCAGEICQPDFSLDAVSRRECTCDDDCEAPLHCVRAGDDATGRCELQCPTTGPWCDGAHVCGDAAMDAAGLAETDSICVSIGE